LAGNPVAVQVDGTIIGAVTTSGTSYVSFTVGPMTISAGSHTITLAGTSGSGDTTLIDPVGIVGAISYSPVNLGDINPAAAVR
jgi:hypothetical protein